MLNQTFIRLVRLGIGHTTEPISSPISWSEIQDLANKQGLAAIVLDGIEKLPDRIRPSKEQSLQWIGEVIQSYENRYEQYRRTIAEMAGFYNSHSYKMMVLKGYACSLNWPNPKHRPSGDIDIWLFGKQKEADVILEQEKGIKIDKKHHHHTVFCWREFMVENHYDFINVHHHKSNRRLEELLKELGQDDSNVVEVYGEKVFLPSPNLHALFLLRHTMSHFAAAEITLRQLLDWAFFTKANCSEINWEWLEKTLDGFGMRQLYDLFNAICVDDLGFESTIFPCVQFNPSMKEMVLHEILLPQYSNDLPAGFIRRVLYKFKRWQANGWKQKMCYKESRWEAFWSGVCAHIIKPSTI